MYYASYSINNHKDLNNHEIYIIDGQNQTQIKQYQRLHDTNSSNPCIPMQFDSHKSIIITFATNEWREWYPLNICDYPNNTNYYANTYLFDGGESLIVNNLTIYDYSIQYDRNYPIISSMNNHNASLTINHGSFMNISSSAAYPMFSTSSSIHMNHNSFVNIKLIDLMFYAYHTMDADDAIRDIIFETSCFQNVSGPMIYRSTFSYNDVKLMCQYYYLQFLRVYST